MFKRRYLLGMITNDYDLSVDVFLKNLYRVEETEDAIAELPMMELDTIVRKVKYLIEHPKAKFKKS